jgi:pyruvate decarboxylase
VSIQPLLSALIAALPSHPQHELERSQLPPPRVPKDKDAAHLVQSQIWPSVQGFLRSGDVIVSETGTSTFGLCDIAFPSNTRYEAQIYYGSIGWATAATLGVDIARKELAGNQGRTLLFTGDGSMALTIQEVGTMIKAKSKAVIFVINNAGYTIERLIWGARQRKWSSAFSSLLKKIWHSPNPKSTN